LKYAAIIQARYGSSRLPGKILMNICGKPVLQWVAKRVQKSAYVDETLVATSIESDNLPVLRLCADMDVRVFAGSEDDVLDRYYQLAKLLQPEYIVRVTADCPCYDWGILDTAIKSMNPETDYLSDFGETLPDGLDIEIMSFTALKTAWNEANLASEREHVTQFIRKRPDRFVHQDFACPYGDFGHLRWTLDEEADLKLIHAIFSHFCSLGKQDFLTEDILELIAAKSEFTKFNAYIARNEGLAKSLMEDKMIKGRTQNGNRAEAL